VKGIKKLLRDRKKEQIEIALSAERPLYIPIFVYNAIVFFSHPP